MKTDRDIVPLGNVIDIIIDRRGVTPFKLGSDWKDFGYKTLSARNVHTGELVCLDQIRFVDEPTYRKWMPKEIQKGDILITSEAPFGNVFYWNSDEKITLGQRLFAIRINKENDSRYIYYSMITDSFQRELLRRCSGSTVTGLRQPELLKCALLLPELSIQKKIGNILSTLDQRIENLRAQNRVLEQTAKTIYDYTFLQCAGHQTTYNKTLNRNIPVDWETDNLYRIADFTNGLACQKYRPITEKDKLPVIKIREMHDGISADTEFVRSDIPEKVIVNPGDLLFSWSASLEVMMWNGVKGGLNQHIFKVTPKEYFSLYFVYFQLKDYIGNFKRMAEARKTTMGHITTDHLNQSRIAIPDEETMKRFSSLVTPLFKKQLVNSQQIETLTTQRNTLLPLLMTGQIEV